MRGDGVAEELEPDIRIDQQLFDIRPYYPEDNAGLMSYRNGSRLERVIYEILDSRQTPFKTKSDFVRTAVFNYAEAVQQQLKLKNATLQRLLLESRMAVRSADNKRWIDNQQETLRNVHDLLVSLINLGALDEIRDTLSEYYRMVLEIQQPFWRNQYLRSMNELASVKLAVALVQASGLGLPSEYVKGVGHVGTVSGDGEGGDGDAAVEGVPADSGGRDDEGVQQPDELGRSHNGRVESVGGKSAEDQQLPALQPYGEPND